MSGGWSRRELLSRSAAAVASFWTLGPFFYTSQASAPIIDGLGEVRIDYEPELIAAMLESGMNAVHITLGNPGHQGLDALDDVLHELAAMDTHIMGHPDLFLSATSVAAIDQARREGRLAILYGLQNAAPLGDSVRILDTLYGYGVRILQLTYNYRNLLGDGALERTDGGLSNFGIEVIERMNEIGMLVDLSHSGETTTLDGVRFSKRPVAFTHTGCRAVFDHPRNKGDEALRELGERGGVVGIYQINPYLSPKERSSLDDYLDHIEHAVCVAGIDHVGIGSDREHRTIPDTAEEKQKLIDELSRLGPRTAATVRWPFFVAELNHPRRMRTIADGLERRGYGGEEIEKILGGNWYRLYGEVIG